MVFGSVNQLKNLRQQVYGRLLAKTLKNCCQLRVCGSGLDGLVPRQIAVLYTCVADTLESCFVYPSLLQVLHEVIEPFATPPGAV